MLRRLWERLRHQVDYKAANLAEWLIYAGWGGGGTLYVAMELGPPVSLRDSMTPLGYQAWSYMNIIGPVAALVGKVLLQREWLKKPGTLFLLMGNFFLAWAAFAFIIGAYQTWGTGAWGTVPTAIICAIACLRSTQTWRALRRERKRRKREGTIR